MNNLKDPFFKIVLAVLPLLGSAFVRPQPLAVFSLAFLGFWAVFLIFRKGSVFFPERMLGLLETAALAAAALLARDFWGIEPFWALSVLYLLFLADKPEDLRSVQKLTLGFWIFGNFMAITSGFLGAQLNAGFFSRPAGTFLLLGFVSWLWQNRPAGGEARPAGRPVEKAKSRRAE